MIKNTRMKWVISLLVVWLFLLSIFWFGVKKSILLSDIDSNTYSINSHINNIECKKSIRSSIVTINIYYNNKSFNFTPPIYNQNYSQSERCNEALKRYQINDNFKAIFLDEYESNPLDLYIGSEHVVRLEDSIMDHKKSQNFFIPVLITIGIFATAMPFLRARQSNQRQTNKFLNSKIVSWILYLNLLFAIVYWLW